jgi:hypothetical protein
MPKPSGTLYDWVGWQTGHPVRPGKVERFFADPGKLARGIRGNRIGRFGINDPTSSAGLFGERSCKTRNRGVTFNFVSVFFFIYPVPALKISTC